MADPLLDEDFILHLLKRPVIADQLHHLQTGSVQALCDLYDRKVTREEFTTQASVCLGLYGQCAKLWMLNNIKTVWDEGDLDDDRLTQAADGLAELVRVQAEQVIEIVKRLKMCPTSKDAVN